MKIDRPFAQSEYHGRFPAGFAVRYPQQTLLFSPGERCFGYQLIILYAY